MNDKEILGTLKESLADVHMDCPVETVIAAGQARRRRTTFAWTSAAVATVAALGLGALTLNGLSTPAVHNGGSGPGSVAAPVVRSAAFTVVRNGDGSVTFTVRDVVDAAAATRALNDAGITGRVVNLGGDPGCTTVSSDIPPADLYPDGTNTWAFRDGSTAATFRSSDYPRGGGLFLIVIRHEPGARRPAPPLPRVVVAVAAFDNAARIPSCLNPELASNP